MGSHPRCCAQASGIWEHVAPKWGSHHLLFLEEDFNDVLMALQPHGMAMMCHDIAERVNRIVKVGYNDHSDRGGWLRRASHTPGGPSCGPSVGVVVLAVRSATPHLRVPHRM